jgi:hypothetical protein
MLIGLTGQFTFALEQYSYVLSKSLNCWLNHTLTSELLTMLIGLTGQFTLALDQYSYVLSSTSWSRWFNHVQTTLLQVSC